MRKTATILIVLSILTMAGSGFLYLQHTGDAAGAVTGVQTPVYAGIAAGVVLLVAMVMLTLDSKAPSRASKEDEGEYAPYDDEEYEDEYEDEEVY